MSLRRSSKGASGSKSLRQPPRKLDLGRSLGHDSPIEEEEPPVVIEGEVGRAKIPVDQRRLRLCKLAQERLGILPDPDSCFPNVGGCHLGEQLPPPRNHSREELVGPLFTLHCPGGHEPESVRQRAKTLQLFSARDAVEFVDRGGNTAAITSTHPLALRKYVRKVRMTITHPCGSGATATTG
jgi:hypothetical protein